MATYTQVSKGTSGDSVLQLQKLLNQNGYSLKEDGIFGNNTLSAVKDYQSKNGLTIDGIVGNNTWGTLTGANKATSNNSSAAASGSADEGFSYKDFTYDDYKESDTVKQANAALQAQMDAKPGAYQSKWQGQIDSIIDSIRNREAFSYDVNNDALYQQYRDQYTALGKLAAQDTMGQAAAMTGGYGNSYASSAGNQAYQQYLSRLNEVVPELYGMARDQHNAEGQELYNQYGLLADQENQEYGRYQDAYSQWASERDHLQGVYNDERSLDYSKYADDRNFEHGKYSDDRNLEYNEYRNAIADQQWQTEYDESVRQYNENMAYQKERDAVSDAQFEKTHALNVNADNRANAAEAREAEAWEMEKKAYEEAKASGGSGNNQAALEHVASMSSEDLVAAMKAYNYDEDNTGLAAFLDDCVASGRLTEAQADNYYDKYRTGNANDKVDTTVKPTGGSGSGGVGGGGGGRIERRYE